MPTVSTGAGRSPRLDQSLDHRLGAGFRARLLLAARCDQTVLQDDPLDVRSSQVEPEVAAHLAVQPPSTTSTVPVTNGAVAR